ncbi:MAG: DUF3656 domain-containing protein [Bacteriovoracaceae bacterium]|nr:DUF3656 domain-containing protein [Bacteriovoracaceae bacterium]
MKFPELLLPVGNQSMALAAIHGGGDAIYLGVPGFNARGRTQDFSIQELKELIDLCHLYGVKVHLAFNVLIFENELSIAKTLLEEILPLGPDAFIVQDVGLIKLIRLMAPEMRIHGSTQMTITNDEAIRLIEDLNIQRFVLGRENSLEEMKTIRLGTNRELEVFVHGALCVAYSGQCFTSESLGGRSANRGQCAQSCRLGYELFVDGEKRDLGDKKYLVSPQDLCAIEEVPELMKIGIDSFKVEGRLKGVEYVAKSAQSYQSAIHGNLNPDAKKEMAISYGRGFFNGWYDGVNHQKLVEGSFSSHRGHEVGKVSKLTKNSVIIETSDEIRAGQGLFFAIHSLEIGAKVFQVKKISADKSEVTLLAPFDYQKLKIGMRTWINSDDKIAGEVKKLMTDRQVMKRIPIDMELNLELNKPAQLKLTDPEGRSAIVMGAVGVAAQKMVDEKVLWDELSALGSTAFILKNKKFSGVGVYLSQKDLKNLRREGIEELTKLRLLREVRVNVADIPLWDKSTQKQQASLNVLLREKQQVEDLLLLDEKSKRNIGTVFLDFEFGKDYQSSVDLLRSSNLKVGICTTRILKPKEYYNLNTIVRLKPDAIMVRNLGALGYLKDKGIDLHGDFSLNVTNHLTAEYLISKGLKSVCASYDLNQTQLHDLARNVPYGFLEVTLHQYMPEFHMEHCVFAAFMSKGSSFKDCGKPCEKHNVEMKDAYGNMHFLKADQECRNTMYRGSAQSAAFLVNQEEIALWRFEALNELGDVLRLKVKSYLELISQEKNLEQVIQDVGSSEKYGVTEGQMSVERAWKDRKKSEDVLT